MPKAIELQRPGGESLSLALHLPEGARDAVPGVLLLHDFGGLDACARALADALVECSFAVLAPDLEPLGFPRLDAWEEEVRVAAEARVPERQLAAELEAILAAAAEHPALDAERLAVVGLGGGGTLGLVLACQSRRVEAVASLGGRIVLPALSGERPMQPLEMLLNLGAPLLGVFGSEDPASPPEAIAALEAKLEQFARAYELELLPGRGMRPYLEAGGLEADGQAEGSVAEPLVSRVAGFLHEALETGGHPA